MESLFLQRTNEEQKKFLNDIGININDDLTKIEEELYEYMQLNGFENDELNDIGIKCEEILDILSDI